jgi:hypothetical protein
MLLGILSQSTTDKSFEGLSNVGRYDGCFTELFDLNPLELATRLGSYGHES